MVDIDYLDREIGTVAEWVRRAGKALLTLENTDGTGFIREAPGTPGKHESDLPKTSTHRSFAALVDFLRFLAEEGSDNSTREVNNATQILVGRLASEYYTKFSVANQKPYRGKHHSAFRDSHLLLALARLNMAHRLIDPSSPLHVTPSFGEAIEKVAGDIKNCIHSDRFDAKETTRYLFHDYITLYAVRAGDAVSSAYQIDAPLTEDYAQLSNVMHQDVLAQLGAYYAKDGSRFDPAELAFRVALLYGLSEQGFSQVGSPALKVIKETQTNNGSWPLARRVLLRHHNVGGREQELHVATYDVALALTMLLSGEISRGREENVDLLTDVLHKTFLHAIGSIAEVEGGKTGWSSDRTRPLDHVESWTTAVVLSFLDRYHTCLSSLRQLQILKKYVVEPRDPHRFPWSDLVPSIGAAPDPDQDIKVFDPTGEGNLKESVTRHFLTPVGNSPVRRPRTISLLLSGPPGTGKTTFVEQLAKSLHWPLLTLSPPDFLEGGLENFEVQAARIFDDLQKLRRVVVLFDECEDFFRRRETDAGSPVSERTMGAFITAGMLPRLQRLRQRRWIIFALSTNISITQLDPAVIRPGRFDFEQYMDNPSWAAQERFVKEGEINNSRGPLRDALRSWDARESEHEERCHRPISFHILQNLIGFVNDNPGCTQSDIEQKIRDQTTPGPPRLTES
ncbi:AAA family ATPase [Streptomyces europaeiscabiei]|uniref:AAA family ATPase n=1 Tax=Streptomyces europaeiscabiei TaxID=146819 RepID=UPI000A3FC51C|nr:ATP-binding protein [Streptomyces europaeiscabiei]